MLYCQECLKNAHIFNLKKCKWEQKKLMLSMFKASKDMKSGVLLYTGTLFALVDGLFNFSCQKRRRKWTPPRWDPVLGPNTYLLQLSQEQSPLGAVLLTFAAEENSRQRIQVAGKRPSTLNYHQACWNSQPVWFDIRASMSVLWPP